MPRHDVNAFMRWVNMNVDAHAAYIADTSATVADWERLGAREVPDPDPTPVGGRLTDEERDALVARDFGALYEMGAHPYLLWSFTEAVHLHELPREEIVRRFRERVADSGYPDFAT